MPVEQLRSQQRHQRILDAATHVFSTKGYHGTLVDEIAAEAETSKGGVYFHFPNKQAIFLALLDRLADILRERVESAVARETDPLARAEDRPCTSCSKRSAVTGVWRACSWSKRWAPGPSSTRA